MHKILHEEPEPLEQFLPDCDPSLSEIVGLAIMKNRDDRYADLSVMKNDLAEVRARIEAPAEDKDTTPMPRDPRFSAPASRAGSHGSKRYDVDRMSLQRRRVEQITALLDEARWMLENGALEKARAKCEEALMFDPDHPVGRELIADIAIEGDRRQVAAWINDARAELQKGQLDSAEPLVAQARELAPESVDVRQLQETIDTTRRTRQMQEIMRRARTRFSEGSFEAAIRAAGEVLALDPENAQAKELQERARESIEQEAARAARDAAARSARTVQDPPRSPSRSGRSIEIADSAARSESAHSVQAASPRSLSRSGQRPAAVSETAHALRGAQEEAPDLPLWQNLQVIAATFGVVLVTVAVGYFAYSSSTPPPSPTGDPASAPRQGPSPTPDPAGSASAGQGPGALVPGNTTVAAQPVAVPPAPPPVVAPAALTEKRALTQDDKDILAAFAFLNGGDIPRAQTLAVGVLRRNPNHPHLLALTTAIEARVVSEKERADAEARRK
jgi:tetratricopeptide (TPR) repeat protein